MTILCTKCGFRNGERDDFCGSCGEFLEFVGERVADPEAPATPVETVIEVEHTETTVEVVELRGVAVETPPSTPAALPPTAPATVAPATVAPADGPTPKSPAVEDVPVLVARTERTVHQSDKVTTSESSPPPDAVYVVADADAHEPDPLLAPGEPVEERPAAVIPAPRQPTAVAPQKAPPRRRPQPVAVAEPALREGDLVCGDCGRGNSPERRFCRGCGTSLGGSVVATAADVKAGGLFHRPEKKVHVAGDRPMRKKGTGKKIARIVAALAVIGVALAVIGPWRSSATKAVKDARAKVDPHFEPVNPVKATATSSLAGHTPDLAVDTGSNTWWAEGAKGNGEGQTISLTFAPPVDLAKIGFSIGANGDDYLSNPRPKDLHITFVGGPATAGKPPVTKDITVKDKADFQLFDVSADGVTRVDIQITSVYLGQKTDAAAISDIQFFRRS